jgi:hypothetical protein
MFSKKHYEAIAKALNDAKPAIGPNDADNNDREAVWLDCVTNIVKAFEADSPRFDRFKFLAAAEAPRK